MESKIKKNTVVLAFSFLTLNAFLITSCQKEQLAQPVEADLSVQHNLSSKNLLSTVTMVNGGGNGTFNSDLDGDNDIDGSHFGMAISIFANGTANGHFECNMAGNADILGLHLMAVEGKVSNGAANADGSATFSGIATVNLGNGVIFRGIPFVVTVTAGGPGTGTLQLTVIGAFDGVPGDTIVGNGNYDLPPETVASGQIKIKAS
jgi:hypothetical protein